MIDRPVDQVWKFMMDFSNAPKWMPEILELRQTSAVPLGVGATLVRKVKRGVFRLRIVDYELNQRVAYEFTNRFVKGTMDSYTLETVDMSTRVTDSVEVRLSGLYRLVGPLVRGRVGKVVEERVANLKRLVESQAES